MRDFHPSISIPNFSECMKWRRFCSTLQHANFAFMLFLLLFARNLNMSDKIRWNKNDKQLIIWLAFKYSQKAKQSSEAELHNGEYIQRMVNKNKLYICVLWNCQAIVRITSEGFMLPLVIFPSYIYFFPLNPFIFYQSHDWKDKTN